MKKILFAAILSSLLTGCLGPKVSPNAVDLNLEFKFLPEHLCSRQSPEIKVTGIPAATKQLKAKLVDLDVPNWDHGGGKVAYTGSDVIPAGSLKAGYNGPCPPSGAHNYQFSVKAVDADGVIIGQGKAGQRFP